MAAKRTASTAHERPVPVPFLDAVTLTDQALYLIFKVRLVVYLYSLYCSTLPLANLLKSYYLH